MEEFSRKRVQTQPCRVCGRTFVPESLAKHQDACKKAAQKKVKVFDSSKQRATEDLSVRQIKQSHKKTVAPPKSNWRAQHQEFVQNIRAAKGAQIAIAHGDPLPPPPPPAQNLDYVTCSYCSRRFNEKAAERHITFCKEQSRKIGSKRQPTSTEKARADARTQFHVPKPKSRLPAGSPSYSNPDTGPRGGYSSGSAGRTTGPMPGNRPQASKSEMTRTPNSTGGYGMGGARVQPGATRGRSTATNPTAYRKTNQSSRASPEGVQGANAYADFDNARGDHEGPEIRHGSGRMLRTGRDVRAYEEAKLDVKGYNSLPRKPKAHHMRGAHVNLTPPSSSSGTSPSGISGYSVAKESESGYYSSNSDPEPVHTAKYSVPAPVKFCHECGSKYATETAKFCCECGMKRLPMR